MIGSIRARAVSAPLLLGVVLGTLGLGASGSDSGLVGMKQIPAGEYRPLFPDIPVQGPDAKVAPQEIKAVPVAQFLFDVYPVTNGEYLEFARRNAKWRRSRAKRLFADSGYLKHWKQDLELGPRAPAKSPATNVSWFAAKAYCAWRGKRLPTVMEWERVASANEEDFKRLIIEWYSASTPAVIPKVGSTFKNLLGIWDLHGLIWEWTSDFNSALVTGESRGDSALERDLFCGGGSLGASDFQDYPAFMRYAFRSSLKGNYTVSNLGFRCAK